MLRMPLSSFLRGKLFFILLSLLACRISLAQNAIVTENALPGNPKSEWDISGAGDLSIQGFATDISVNKGQTVRFKIDAGSGTAYTINIYRLGYYGGNGARLVANLGSFTGTSQPNPQTNTSTGLVNCGNWTESASWAVPSTAVSGLYIARLRKTSNGGASHIVFIVRDDAGNSDILFKTSDATWQAYNVYGGNSLYNGSTSYPSGHATKVSYNRPFITRNGGGGGGAMEDWFMNAEYPMIRFLERNGYNVSYTTDVDMERDQSLITPSIHKILISCGHDEYWSLGERNKFEAARNAGVHLAFFSGNEVYWKTRWEDSYRTLVCYKEGSLGENVCGNKCDPTSAWTGLWREGENYDAGKPENALTGQISWSDVTSSLTITGAFRNFRFWRNTSVASLAANGSVTFTSGTLGYEWDYQQYADSYPNGQIILSTQTVSGKVHKLSLYRHPSGALVFGAGTVQWSWGLDNVHDRGSAAPTVAMQQATVNLFADMGVQPGSLMSGLVAATASTDFTAPTVAISSPAHGAVITPGSNQTISGTASDVGGVLAGVEVSTDGGATWKVASGTTNWSFSWTAPSSNQVVNIRVRGFDDSGNMSVPGSTGSSSNITVTVGTVADQTPPTVNITAPAGGTVLGTINVTASASDNIGVAGVQFLLDGANLGSEDLSSPYSVSWNTTSATNGTHTLTARARDAAGNVTTSSAVIVTVSNPVDTDPPTVAITSPSGGANVAGTINVTASATDNAGVAGVQFLLNGSNLGAEDLSSPYSVSWATTGVSNGSHTLTARARDAAGNVTTSSQVVVIVNNTNLVAAYSFNENSGSIANDHSGNNNNGTLTNGPAWSSSGRYGTAIQFDGSNDYVNVPDAASLDLTNGMTIEAWVNPSNLTGYKTVICKDRTSSTFSYVLSANNNSSNTNNQRPNTRLRIGSSNRTVTGTSKLALNTWTHLASTYDGTTIRLYVNGVQVSTLAITGNITVSANPLRIGGSTALSGQYFAGLIDEVRIYNRALSQSEIQTDMNTPIGTDAIAPSVNITAPTAGVVAGTINVSANATDNVGVAGVQFLLDGNNLGAEDLVAPYEVAWNTTTATNSSHTLTARARDGFGNLTTSAPVIVTVNNIVDTEAPSVNLTAPAAGNVSGVIDVSASAADNVGVAGVQFLLNGNPLGAEDLLAPYTVSWNTTTVINGTYTLTARARDAAGNTTTSSGVVVTVNNAPDTSPPNVALSSPSSGTVTGTINLTANATDNVTVAGVQFLLNGANFGAEILSPPYAMSWNTTTVPNGSYTLAARARDAAGNVSTSADVSVTVNNNSNLIVALGMNEGSGTSTADISGKNHDGTLVSSPTWTAGRFGQGLSLNGTSSYVNIPDHTDFTLNPTESYTWSAWVRNNNFNEWTTIWSQTLDGGNFFYFYAHTSSDPDGGPVTNGISAYWWTNSGTNKVGVHSSDNVLTAGQWSHISVVYDASQPQNNRFTIYVNGVDVTVRTDVSSVGTLQTINPTNIRIGSNQPFGEYLNGSVDEVRFYQRALTSGEVNVDMNTPITNDFTSPTVSITSPTGGAQSGTVNVTAAAADNIAVAGVQFLVDGNNIGAEVLVPPYTVAWNSASVSNGTHTLTARARDAAGNSSTSEGVVITTNNDTQAPTVAITAPGPGTVNGTITVSATANDNVGVAGVQFLLDGNILGTEVLNAPYSISWNTTGVADGSHTITARARDGAGNITVSAGVAVTVQNTPPDVTAPTVSLTAPAAGNVSGTINVTASASDNVGVVGVQFLLNGNPLGSEDLASPYSVSWNTMTVANGTYTLTARARDLAGNTTTSAGVVVTVNNAADASPPSVNITAPTAGSVNGSVTVSASATDNTGVTGVQFLLNGTDLEAEDLAAPYSISWNTLTVPNGNYTLTARARDAAGNTATSAPVIVTVNNNSNLILSLNLNEGTGTTANDNSGLSHHGTLVNGPTWGTGKFGQALNFDGTNDYINIPDHSDFTLDPAQSYTWTGWVRNNNFNEWSTWFSQTIDGNNFFYIYTHSSSDPDGGPVTNGVSAYWWTTNGSNKVGVHSNNNVLTTGTWNYLTVVYDGTQAQNNRFSIYVNGTDVTARTDVSSTGTLAIINPTNIRVASNQPFGEYLNGSVDELKFYKRALSPSEILAEMGTPIGNGIIPTVSPVNGATNVQTNANVNVVFNVAMDAATINSSTLELRNSSNALVPSTVTFNAITRTATLTPSSALVNSTTYSATIKGGASGVKDLSGNTMTADFNWSFTTADPPLIAPTEGPGGPILVISTTANPFSRYAVEILRAEGLNHFGTADISTVNATMLNSYDVVILGEMTVTSPQVTMLTNWVNAGGTLIAFKPSSLLNSLFGISAASGTLSDKYLLVNTSSGPGAGIVNQTIQFHGTANLHTLSGATSLATLYSAASTATSNPAVTLRNVGSNGGKAVAFTFDLAKSIIYTRQGNPAWAGQKRDNDIPPIRPDDMFYPDWIDFNKVAIPQADEQQRLLANIILQGSLHRKPLPRFWYLPRDLKAAIVMTGDDHATGGTAGRFNQYLTLGPNTDQDVANWNAIRGTSYIYPNLNLSNSAAVSYQSQGFEIALHPTTNCDNFSSLSSLSSTISTQLDQLAGNFPGISAPVTNRTHCMVWSDWATMAKAEAQNGIRFDVNYYYWPQPWMQNRPGMFTGSGIPMRFADLDGTIIDIYQAPSQMTDETNMNYTTFCNTVLDKAVGAEGYYGIFTCNMHTDANPSAGSDAIIASAKARSVPVVSSKQMLTWLDGRNNSYFGNIEWNNNQLTFSITARSGALNLRSMLPVNSASGQLVSITMDGNPVAFTTQTIKGMQYAFFNAPTGIHNYVATYSSSARMLTGKTDEQPAAEVASSTSSATEDLSLGSRLFVSVVPNPTQDHANVVITSNNPAPVSVTVTNIFGQVIEKHDRVLSTGILRIGHNWKSGTYLAEVIQGNQKKVVKIIKVN